MSTIITKNMLHNVFAETVKEFSEKVFEIKQPVELVFVDKESFMDSVKKDRMIQIQIDAGMYKDIDKEYPNFLTVYKYHKSPLHLMFGMPVKVSLCFEIARERLKPFTAKEVKAYLKHGFAHEITHVFEDLIKHQRTDLWDTALNECAGDESLAHEYLSEHLADMVGDVKTFKQVESKLWYVILKRVEKIRQSRRG